MALFLDLDSDPDLDLAVQDPELDPACTYVLPYPGHDSDPKSLIFTLAFILAMTVTLILAYSLNLVFTLTSNLDLNIVSNLILTLA